jgi:ASC-1-like (ASCH) protein
MEKTTRGKVMAKYNVMYCLDGKSHWHMNVEADSTEEAATVIQHLYDEQQEKDFEILEVEAI